MRSLSVGLFVNDVWRLTVFQDLVQGIPVSYVRTK